jgi:hypothetical protein
VGPNLVLAPDDWAERIADPTFGDELEELTTSYQLVPISPTYAYTFGTPPDICYIQGVPFARGGDYNTMAACIMSSFTLVDTDEVSYTYTSEIVDKGGTQQYYLRIYVNGRFLTEMPVLKPTATGTNHGETLAVGLTVSITSINCFVDENGVLNGTCTGGDRAYADSDCFGVNASVVYADGATGTWTRGYGKIAAFTTDEIALAMGVTKLTAGKTEVRANWS